MFIAILMCFKQETELGAGASLAGDGEILDGVVTRSRGEIKHMCSPKVSSSTTTPARDLTNIQSPRFSEKAYSPRVSELRGGKSPLSSGKGPYSPRSGETRSSQLGKSPHNTPPN